MIFSNYDENELRECGEAFELEFKNRDIKPPQDWTNEVKDWFSKTRRVDDIRVFCHPNDSEFMFDLCHTTYLPRDHCKQRAERWKEALALGRCRLMLAMECEWGKMNNVNESFFMIMNDAWKIAISRCTVKIMAFASQRGAEDRDEIVDSLAKLRKHCIDPSPWLWIDAPWRGGIEGNKNNIKTGFFAEIKGTCK